MAAQDHIVKLFKGKYCLHIVYVVGQSNARTQMSALTQTGEGRCENGVAPLP
jgi:hypothetical protein